MSKSIFIVLVVYSAFLVVWCERESRTECHKNITVESYRWFTKESGYNSTRYSCCASTSRRISLWPTDPDIVMEYSGSCSYITVPHTMKYRGSMVICYIQYNSDHAGCTLSMNHTFTTCSSSSIPSPTASQLPTSSKVYSTSSVSSSSVNLFLQTTYPVTRASLTRDKIGIISATGTVGIAVLLGLVVMGCYCFCKKKLQQHVNITSLSPNETIQIIAHRTVDETSVRRTSIEELVMQPTHIRGNEPSISIMREAPGHGFPDGTEKLNTNIEMYNSPYGEDRHSEQIEDNWNRDNTAYLSSSRKYELHIEDQEVCTAAEQHPSKDSRQEIQMDDKSTAVILEPPVPSLQKQSSYCPSL